MIQVITKVTSKHLETSDSLGSQRLIYDNTSCIVSALTIQQRKGFNEGMCQGYFLYTCTRYY